MLELKENRTEPQISWNQPDEPQLSPRFFERREVRIVGFSALGIFGAIILIFGFFYVKFARMIDRRLAACAFSNTISIYTRPRTI